MRVRRCAHLMVELDQEPRFEFATLLEGGDGLDRSPRWLACAPHLPAPVPVTLALLAVLEQVPRDDWTPLASLEEAHGTPIAALLAAGLLVVEGDAALARDEAARDLAWWTPALLAQAQGGWSEVDIDARQQRGLTLDSGQMVDAFGAAPAADYRHAGGGTALPLPRPRRSGFDELLDGRRTCRNFDPQAVLDGDALATMLRRVWGAVGTRELAPGVVAVKKTSPAGGGLHAVEAYVLVQRAEGVTPGLYHYQAMAHALAPLRALSPEEAAAHAHRFVAGQQWFADVPVMVIMVARFDRLFWKYRRHTKAWRVVHLDVGHLSQTMYLSAADLGLGGFVTAAINDSDIEQALALPPLRHAAIALVGFGARAATTVTPELDTFDPLPLVFDSPVPADPLPAPAGR